MLDESEQAEDTDRPDSVCEEKYNLTLTSKQRCGVGSYYWASSSFLRKMVAAVVLGGHSQ